MTSLLEVEDLVVDYPLRRGLAAWLGRQRRPYVRAVNQVSFRLAQGEAMGLVGESGCGKSTLGRALLKLERATSGSVKFAGQRLDTLAKAELLAMRRRAQMIFQDPLGALNSRLTIRQTLTEVLRVHGLCQRAEEAATIAGLLHDAGLSLELLDRRPRSLSGGQCQRVVIARALAIGADFLVADEPTSSLDVSIQAQIINLFKSLREKRHLTLLFISHDLRIVRYLCDTVAVMYLGRIVEYGSAERVFSHPKHPYTQALIASAPRLGGLTDAVHARGEPPSPANPPAGCPFHPRCPYAFAPCRVEPFPPKTELADGAVWCHLYSSPEAPKVMTEAIIPDMNDGLSAASGSVRLGHTSG